MDIDLTNLPENLDPEQAMQAFAALESGAEPVPTPEPVAELPKEEPKAEPAAAAPQSDESTELPGNEPEAAGVATKDGKHVIPYTVLQNERQARTRAEQTIAELQEKIAALEAPQSNQGANQGESARTETAQAAVDTPSDEDLAYLEENFPTVHKALIATQKKLEALQAKVDPVTEAVQTQEQRERDAVRSAVQEAIDSVPKLAHIQSNDADAFALARQFDATLRNSQKWAGKPMAERFAKVVEMVEAAHGPIAIPGVTPAAPKPAAPAAPQDPAALRAAALAKAAATARAAPPTSLSDFPAGSPAATSEQQALEQMSALQIAEKFGAMSPEALDTYLSNL